MGWNFSVIKGLKSGEPTKRIILLLGLDGAGKTTLLFRLRDNEFTDTVPTIGLNIEEIDYKGTGLTLWDVSGKSRKLWKHYYDRVDAIIFVVDSSDPDRIEDVKSELANLLLEPTLNELPMLIFWNKADISTDTSVELQLFEKLKWLKTSTTNFEIAPWSAKTGVGVWEGIGKLVHLFK